MTSQQIANELLREDQARRRKIRKGENAVTNPLQDALEANVAKEEARLREASEAPAETGMWQGIADLYAASRRRTRLTWSEYLAAVSDETPPDPPQHSFFRDLTWRDVFVVCGLIFALYMFATHVAGAAPWPVRP
jgi:hypothetical protein